MTNASDAHERSRDNIEVRELIAWKLDDSPSRDAALTPGVLATAQIRGERFLKTKPPFCPESALLGAETNRLAPLLASILSEDLQHAFHGLDWSLGVVDLRRLLAFQRRLLLDPNGPPFPPIHPPQEGNWNALLALAAGQPRGTGHTTTVRRQGVCSENASMQTDIVLRTGNPDVCVLVDSTSGGESLSLSLYGGSPFFEVAEFRNRWFLRDGYHRAFHLLRAGVSTMIAVVIHARSMEEVGATKSQFFPEDVLFSTHPPRITDFLRDELTITYSRRKRYKTIHIRIEEAFEMEPDTRRDSI